MSIEYTPPATIKAFIKDYRPGELFYDWIVGPVGSGKTTGLFMKLAYMAGLQEPGPDGIRRTRAVIVRNTAPQLRDTTISSWNYWFKHGQAGDWKATEKVFVLRFGDVECEVMFRPLDTPDDVARVLSLEVTFAILDEFVQIPKEIVEALSARLGRYPSKAMTPNGATNWGMWGSSNPDTEDNWWYDYLHNNPSVRRYQRILNTDPDAVTAEQAIRDAMAEAANQGAEPSREQANALYFVQPSGFDPAAENIENLPGGRGYYTNQAKGKSEAWIKQFLEAEWGYSAAGKPVVPTFKADLHVAKGRLKANPQLPLVVGLDPGLGGSALIFGQQDPWGRLLVLAELVQEGYGIERLIKERMKPFVMRHFPELADNIVIAPDPAAYNRAQTDEKSVIDIVKRYYDVAKDDKNNRMPIRLNAIEHFTLRLVEMGPALQIDAQMCPVLVRALKGGWRYIIDTKRSTLKPEPEKNNYSHPGDSFGYLCRYFHRGAERELRRAEQSRRFNQTSRRLAVGGYHYR